MKTGLVWFRNDLRSEDNVSLSRAIQDCDRVIGIYCFDPRQFVVGDFGFKKTEKYRAQFLIETVANLRYNLGKLNISLVVVHDLPENAVPQLIEEHDITALYSQKEWTEEENKVTAAVETVINISHHAQYDQFLFHPDDIPFESVQDIPQVFTQFRKKCEKESSVRDEQLDNKKFPESNLIEKASQIPTLEDLGLDRFEKDSRTAFPWKGGQDAAWERLNDYFWNTEKLAYYKKTRNGLVGKDYSSKFSAWLANGALSARQIYWEVKRFESQIKKNQDTYWLIFELIWRDYFKYVSLKHGNDIFKIGGILHKEYDWINNEKAQQDWINGNTKYDFVNANMVELKETGWMSNRGRQNVASFWAKEQEQDWRVGAAYFESMLIDYDVHSNWGNWMYNAGVGNDPRDRKFNIDRQAQIYDGSGKFVRMWLQEQLF